MKIVIEISGGTVQAVYAGYLTSEGSCVEIIDYDDFEHDGTTDEEAKEILTEAIEGLKVVY